ncbi:MAG: hypothetical protein FWG99_07150 [Treponema sp.]|nr:hypothetical protein [Treponema sp.]
MRKIDNRIYSGFALIFCLLIAAGCESPAGNSSKFVAVSNISSVANSTEAGVPLALNGTVNPANATNKSIVWTVSVNDNGSTGVSISGNILNTTAGGMAIIRATIANGSAQGIAFTKDFYITVNPGFVAVTNISDVPTTATAGTPLALSGTVSPSNATYKNIIWSISPFDDGSTGASITSIFLNTTSEGTAIIRATIANGNAQGNYTQDFNITVNDGFVAVTSINDVPTTAIAGTPLNLTGTVLPVNATNQNIIWSVSPLDDGSTGASITGNSLNTTSEGTTTIRATITDGSAVGDYIQDFYVIVIIVPVNNISGIPSYMTAGTPLILNGTASPFNATYKNIIWSVSPLDNGITGASISGNILNTTSGGTAIIRAAIENGSAQGIAYTQDFYITVNVGFVAVTNISDVPTTATARVPLNLTGTVTPVNATYQNIIWSVSPLDNGSTGASISSNILNTMASGTATIRANIFYGPDTVYYTQDFNITVNICPVSNITDVPGSTTVGTPINLTGTALPPHATYQNIIWSVSPLDNGSTGASITGNILNTTAWGTTTIRATVDNGSAVGIAYTQDFYITVNIVPVSIISGVPGSTTAGIPLTLGGTVSPLNATYQNIIWSVSPLDSGNTGASISDNNVLNTTFGGTVTVRATIENGSAIYAAYTQDFYITVNIVPVSNISGVPNSTTAGIPLTLGGTISPSNATYQNIIWSISPFDNGSTGTSISGNVLNTTAGGTATIRATITNGSAVGTTYTQDFYIAVAAPPAIVLSIDDFNIIDEGSGVFDNVPPIVLSKSAGTSRTINTSGLSVIAWHLGLIQLGTGSSITLTAAQFNTGNYTLSLTFIQNGKPWLGSLEFSVIE